MRFETKEDLVRETKAIERFVKLFSGSYKKLGPNDIDFRVFDKDKKIVAYVEVKGKSSWLKQAFPVYVAVVMWACNDGIVYAKVPDIIGEIRWGGRTDIRDEGINDQELMAYFDYQKSFKYLKY